MSKKQNPDTRSFIEILKEQQNQAEKHKPVKMSFTDFKSIASRYYGIGQAKND